MEILLLIIYASGDIFILAICITLCHDCIVTGFEKTCIVRPSDFEYLEIYKTTVNGIQCWIDRGIVVLQSLKVSHLSLTFLIVFMSHQN